MRRRSAQSAPASSGTEAAQQIAVSIDPPVAQERPVAPRLLDRRQAAVREQNFLRACAGPREHFAERIDDERVAPKLQTVLHSHAIDYRDRKSTRLNSSHPSISYAV